MAANVTNQLCTLIKDSKANMRKLARDSGVPYSTLYEVCQGKIKNPGVNTLAKIAQAMGYKLKLSKTQERRTG